MTRVGLRRHFAVGVCRVLRRAWGWRLTGTPPATKTGILIGAPHTSNWDFVAMLLITWQAGIAPKFLGKKELFRFPLGPLARLAGGIPVDRANPHSVIPALVAKVAAGEQFFLVITPDGTRGKKQFWKSGFYRLATDTGLPVTLCFIDRATRTAGFGPPLPVTGHVAADMQLVRDYYADKGGIHPDNKTEPVLRNERDLPRGRRDPE